MRSIPSLEIKASSPGCSMGYKSFPLPGRCNVLLENTTEHLVKKGIFTLIESYFHPRSSIGWILLGFRSGKLSQEPDHTEMFIILSLRRT